MKTRLKLNEGETIKLISSRSKGTMAEMDIYTYSVLNSNGDVVGSVKHTDHTAIRGFQRTQTLNQTDNLGNVIIDVTW
ncbi:hypothetical protein [Aliivibrio fischeri]|uniref:hypothetical protein n=1 Tax=Aliivibrio fischeri TaxID=668 RepID=UPI0006D10653|nr:hypothetical protein [Aliivibrio fischeri]USR97103.1 hypothetical protein AVFI_18130 [Aliivibrio fischeri ATCC 7744 = JCM 18803 = DSM 507]GGK50335.1 hypothetical protein GCM10007987_36850 [Aliivibrio fischeri]